MNHKQTHYHLFDVTVGYIYRCNSKALHSHYREHVIGDQWLKVSSFHFEAHIELLLLSSFPLFQVLKDSLTKTFLYLFFLNSLKNLLHF